MGDLESGTKQQSFSNSKPREWNPLAVAWDNEKSCENSSPKARVSRAA